jgi:serine/threonine protein kinase
MDLLRWRRGQKGQEPAGEAAAHEGELPSRINHYRIRGSLGQGGMGVVYLAEDERLGRNVALKVLRNDSTDPSAHLRLVREARIAAGVSHPLICRSSSSASGTVSHSLPWS